MSDRVYNVLFLSQRNSARSILAQAILNSIGHGRFRTFSAGMRPAARLDPVALDVLQHAGLRTTEYAPRHYAEFAGEAAPALDFVFTLSDTAAGEPLPRWPGHPITAHWRCSDPLNFTPGSEEHRMSLRRTSAELERRLRLLMNLPLESLDRMSLQHSVDGIAAHETATSPPFT